MMIFFFILFLFQVFIQSSDTETHQAANTFPRSRLHRPNFRASCNGQDIVNLRGFEGFYKRIGPANVTKDKNITNGFLFEKILIICSQDSANPHVSPCECFDFNPKTMVMLEKDPQEQSPRK